MANLETDTRSCHNWFDDKPQKIEQQFLKTMKSNFEEKEKYDKLSGKTKHESSRPMGKKVSTIAHMFQTLSQQKTDNNPLAKSPTCKDAPSLDRVQSPEGYKTERSSSLPAFPHSNCSLSRRGSHLARFNNAKAMFEKLEKGKSADSKNSAETKPRASSVAYLDNTKNSSNNAKKKVHESSKSKLSETQVNSDKSVFKKTAFTNDNFSKVTAETLKPIRPNPSKKDNTHVSSENKNNFSSEDKFYQKVIIQNETNLGLHSAANDLPCKKIELNNEDIAKSASYSVNLDNFTVRTDSSVTKLEQPSLANSHLVNKTDDAKEERKFSPQTYSAEYKSNFIGISSMNDKKTVKTSSSDNNDPPCLGSNAAHEDRESLSNITHRKKAPCLSTESDLAYDNFQSALENSKHCVNSSPFKVQIDNIQNRTFDVDSFEQNPEIKSTKPECDLQSPVDGNISYCFI